MHDPHRAAPRDVDRAIEQARDRFGRGGRGDKPDRDPFAAIGVKRERRIVWRVEQTAQVFLESNTHETT